MDYARPITIAVGILWRSETVAVKGKAGQKRSSSTHCLRQQRAAYCTIHYNQVLE